MVNTTKNGELYTSLGSHDKALVEFELMSHLYEEVYTNAPEDIESKNNLAISHQALGETHSELGNLDKALVNFEITSKLFEELCAICPDNLLFKENLILSYFFLGRNVHINWKFR